MAGTYVTCLGTKKLRTIFISDIFQIQNRECTFEIVFEWYQQSVVRFWTGTMLRNHNQYTNTKPFTFDDTIVASKFP